MSKSTAPLVIVENNELSPVENNELSPVDKAFKELAIDETSLIAEIYNVAVTGMKRKVTKDGQGNIISEEITEDPSIKLKALEKLIELRNKPKRRRSMFFEDEEY